eukprot:maker-scaffold_20-snap-gene-5.3-mRNA-1 protein AED:0.02 eAED:0.02 QI:84/1/1/1/0.66/0.5/4/92/362
MDETYFSKVSQETCVSCCTQIYTSENVVSCSTACTLGRNETRGDACLVKPEPQDQACLSGLSFKLMGISIDYSQPEEDVLLVCTREPSSRVVGTVLEVTLEDMMDKSRETISSQTCKTCCDQLLDGFNQEICANGCNQTALSEAYNSSDHNITLPQQLQYYLQGLDFLDNGVTLSERELVQCTEIGVIGFEVIPFPENNTEPIIIYALMGVAGFFICSIALVCVTIVRSRDKAARRKSSMLLEGRKERERQQQQRKQTLFHPFSSSAPLYTVRKLGNTFGRRHKRNLQNHRVQRQAFKKPEPPLTKEQKHFTNISFFGKATPFGTPNGKLQAKLQEMEIQQASSPKNELDTTWGTLDTQYSI